MRTKSGGVREATLGLIVICLATNLILNPTLLSAQTRPKVSSTGIDRPASVIYIGNSFFYYNNGIQNHVGRLLAADDPAYDFRQTLVGIGGAGLNWHDVESYFRPNAIGSYSIKANNDLVFNQSADKLFDLAIMMDCSQCPVHPQLRGAFVEYGKKHSQTVRRHGAVPIFFMSWAYADRPEMTAQLAEQYTLAGNENDALVIPAGLAFAKATSLRPAVNLYQSDLRHPSLAGTYLAACTIYYSLFHRAPTGLKYTAGLDTETAGFLQKIAWETVQEYFRN